MSVWDLFLGWFKDDNTLSLDMVIGDLTTEIFYKELAIQACVNLIANTVSRGEFLTFEKGKEIRGENYYSFNVSPNQNKSSSKFWRDVIQKLVKDNECLVIQRKDMFYVAESFNKVEFALKDNIYKDITITNYELKDTFAESDVFHFELHDQKIKTVIDGLYKSYAKLVSTSQANYKRNNARRGKLDIPTSYPKNKDAQKELEELFQDKFKRFFEAEGGAILPLTNNLKYEELESNIGVKNGSDGREIRDFIDDIFDFVAIAFQVPPQLLKGNVADTDKAFNNFLTFCINPLAELITDEINRKLYGKKEYLNRTYIKLDTTRIKHTDIKDIAGSLDILTRIGAYTVDDSLRTLGMEPLDTDASKARWMTKNYQNIEQSYGGE